MCLTVPGEKVLIALSNNISGQKPPWHHICPVFSHICKNAPQNAPCTAIGRYSTAFKYFWVDFLKPQPK